MFFFQLIYYYSVQDVLIFYKTGRTIKHNDKSNTKKSVALFLIFTLYIEEREYPNSIFEYYIFLAYKIWCSKQLYLGT